MSSEQTADPVSTEASDAIDNDWLGEAWDALPERSRIILTRRLTGETLDNVALPLHLTRERVRQLQVRAEAAIVDVQTIQAPELARQLEGILGDQMAVPVGVVDAMLPTRANTARSFLLRQLGFDHPKAWGQRLTHFWARDPDVLDQAVHQLTSLMPMTETDANQAAAELGMPAALPVEQLLLQPESKLTKHSLGWIRTARTGRDLAYLWLRNEGEPRSVADIASVTGTSEHAIRETMRREDDFAQVRPEGTWALADWRLPGADAKYVNAVDVVTDVLRELGPLSFDDLCAEAVRRYPVTTWRVRQCVSNSVVGITSGGLYDLSERGATPIEDTEPRRPTNIEVHGDVVGVQIPVSHDLLRGSGLGVSRWLTWHLGLRTAPSTRYFALGEATLTVKRGTSVSQISSLRSQAVDMGLIEGCRLVLLLHEDTNAASLQHACPVDVCPANLLRGTAPT